MHGVKRQTLSDEAVAARRERERARLEEYLNLTDTVLDRKEACEYTKEAFDLTTRLLQINPEFYTIWNYRREIFARGLFVDSQPEVINELLSTDLNMTTAALKTHPKVYWIWNHRKWCLENIPDGPGHEGAGVYGWKKQYWDRELQVIEKMLTVDPRNFHAWNYRRYALQAMPESRSDSAELAFTAKKIGSNFSNFSAWHQRSKVYTLMWEKGLIDREKTREQEFELVRNAMYTDPNDQSAWMYHRWLIGQGDDLGLLESEIAIIQELLDEQPDSKWCMESLVHYKTLIIKKHAAETEPLVQECLTLLRQLESIDPLRASRYRTLSRELK